MTPPAYHGELLVKNAATAAFFLAALAFTLLVHGAIPFFAAPTLGQALWVAGFGHSFVNDSLFSIHANNFGWPAPAPIAFGLTGAYPSGLLIAAGFNALDAYSAVIGLWLAIAFYGAWKFARLVGLETRLSILAALVWTTMPALWGHSGYSMLSIGIALMPFYLWVALRAVLYPPTGLRSGAIVAVGYMVTCLISAFTDGYTFAMFAVGAASISLVGWIRGLPGRRIYLFIVPVQVVSFALGYLSYKAYFSSGDQVLSPMDFFRGWGADVTFLVIPTQGMLWVWDVFNLSIERSNAQFFGDASVWTTTFALPVVIAGLLGWWKSRRKTWFTVAFLFAGLFGFYMALGPSLKINSIKSAEIQQVMMPESVAIAPTGSEILSARLPGFQSMRASYRWSVLGFVCFWILTLLLVVHAKEEHKKVLFPSLLSLLVLLNLPDPTAKWHQYKSNRERFVALEEGVIDCLRDDLVEGELVAFLPFRNDFLATYVAPRINIRTYNTGGDKNLIFARQYWPDTMKGFGQGVVRPDFGDKVIEILMRNEADVVVLPYFDLLHAAHDGRITNFYEEAIRPVVNELKRVEGIELFEREAYVVVRKKPSSS